jgi:hypothetical protein
MAPTDPDEDLFLLLLLQKVVGAAAAQDVHLVDVALQVQAFASDL